MPLITSETAAAMARKGHIARRLNLERKRQAELATAKPVIVPPLPDFAKERLARVREQLSKIDEMIESEQDPIRLDRLCAASERLSEVERRLADRPLPGSKRPDSPAKRNGRPSTWSPVESTTNGVPPAPQETTIPDETLDSGASGCDSTKPIKT